MTAPDARALLKKYDLRAKKSWGQNFLVDERTYTSIVDACELDPAAWVIEIGAGLGTLTWRLAEKAGHVVAVERDRDMAAILRAELGAHPRIEIAEANALTYDYAAVAERAGKLPSVAGNLPYQIASQILFRLIEARRHLSRIVIMLQREMADRIIAKPDTEHYGALTAMVAMYGDARRVCKVHANAFIPAPRVESAVVRITPFPGGATRVPVRDEQRFSDVVHAAFNQRRKTLRNALSALAGEAVFHAAGIDSQRRGETLSVDEFARLADATLEPHA